MYLKDNYCQTVQRSPTESMHGDILRQLLKRNASLFAQTTMDVVQLLGVVVTKNDLMPQALSKPIKDTSKLQVGDVSDICGPTKSMGLPTRQHQIMTLLIKGE